jgi:hypothetical protein
MQEVRTLVVHAKSTSHCWQSLVSSRVSPDQQDYLVERFDQCSSGKRQRQVSLPSKARSLDKMAPKLCENYTPLDQSISIGVLSVEGKSIDLPYTSSDIPSFKDSNL